MRVQEGAKGSSLGSLATQSARGGGLHKGDTAAPREAVREEARAVQRDAAGGGDEGRPETPAGKVSKYRQAVGRSS